MSKGKASEVRPGINSTEDGTMREARTSFQPATLSPGAIDTGFGFFLFAPYLRPSEPRYVSASSSAPRTPARIFPSPAACQCQNHPNSTTVMI